MNVPPQLNQLVIESMLRLPGLSADTLLQAIKGNTFDHISAIYNLLVDRLESTMPNLPSIQSIPGEYLPDGAHQLEKVIYLSFIRVYLYKQKFYLISCFTYTRSRVIFFLGSLAKLKKPKRKAVFIWRLERLIIQQEDIRLDLVIQHISLLQHILIIICQDTRLYGLFPFSIVTWILKFYRIRIYR